MILYDPLKPADQMTEEELAHFYAKCMEDYHFFAQMVLGHVDMNDEHLDLCRFLEKDSNFKLILMPRYTFKSCIITQGISLWELLQNPDSRILIYSDSATKAQNFLLGIKNHIEGKTARSRFREFFPAWETTSLKGKWNDSQINISLRKAGSVEPSVDTGGIETSKVGIHCEMIIFDDIVSDLNVTTKAQMDKVHDCYKKGLSLLKPGGKIIITGTRWHFADFHGRVIKENEEKKIFDIFIRKAEEGDKLYFDNIGEASLTREFLDQQKSEQGSYIYSCLYQNNPISDESAMFKYDDFKFYGSLKESNTPALCGLYDNLYITGTLDPAGEGEDFTAGTVCGTDSRFRIYILELLNKRNCTPAYMIDWILAMNRKYRFVKFGVETIFFRGMFERDLQKKMGEERLRDSNFNNFGVEKFLTRWRHGEGKKVRIEGMQPYHERGDILFPGTSVETLKGAFGDLAYQMMQTTRDHMPEPNDLIDALSWQISIVQKGGMPEPAGPPKNSPAWLEEKWIEDHNRMQRRLPSRMRRHYEPSLS